MREERPELGTVPEAFSVGFNLLQTEFPRFLGSVSTPELVARISKDSCFVLMAELDRRFLGHPG